MAPSGTYKSIPPTTSGTIFPKEIQSFCATSENKGSKSLTKPIIVVICSEMPNLCSNTYYIIYPLYLQKITYNMAELLITAVPEQNSISIKIEYPRISNLSYNFKLIIQVMAQDIANRQSRKVYERIFHTLQTHIIVKDLQYLTLYKLVIKNSYSQ